MIFPGPKMVFLERINKKLTMAVMPKVSLATDKKVVGDVFLQFPKTSNVRKTIIKHSTGHFLFIDFPEGEYSVSAGGNYYKKEEYLLDTKTIQHDQPFIDIYLNPKANYPFPEGMTVLKGKIVDMDERPLFKSMITIQNMTQNANSEDNGDFYIIFEALDEDKNIILNITTKGYKFKQVPVILKKDTTTRIGAIKLDKG